MSKIPANMTESAHHYHVFLFTFCLNSVVFSDLYKVVKISQHTGSD